MQNTKRFRLGVLLIALLLLAACQPIQPESFATGTVPTIEGTQAAPPAEGTAPAGDAAFAGEWEGMLEVPGLALRIHVSLEEGNDGWRGTIDIPAQGATDLPLHTISVNAPNIEMQMLEGAALGLFTGALDDEGAIAGVFTQMGVEGAFSLGRPVAVEESDLPYVVEHVTFPSTDATLAGTLTKPEGSGPFPAIVLVSGSGPQNRDEELPMLVDYAPFREIADRLTESGFAVLRYDDRGVGESTGDFNAATTSTFAEDARAAIAFLRSLPEVDPAQVGILGHSEGANVAAKVAAGDSELAYVVAWAGTAVPGDEVLLLQSGLQMEKAGSSAEEVAQYRDELATALEFAKAGDEEGLRNYLDSVIRVAYNMLSEQEREALGASEEAIANQVEAQVASLASPWMIEFMEYNPADDWAHVTAPVLAFFGGLDTQVDPDQNRPPFEAALEAAGNPDVTVEVLPRANHLFVEAVTGAASEYSSLSPELMPEFLDTLASWLVAHATFVQ